MKSSHAHDTILWCSGLASGDITQWLPGVRKQGSLLAVANKNQALQVVSFEQSGPRGQPGNPPPGTVLETLLDKVDAYAIAMVRLTRE